MYRNKIEHKPVNLFFLILNFISMACLTKNKKLFKNSEPIFIFKNKIQNTIKNKRDNIIKRIIFD